MQYKSDAVLTKLVLLVYSVSKVSLIEALGTGNILFGSILLSSKFVAKFVRSGNSSPVGISSCHISTLSKKEKLKVPLKIGILRDDGGRDELMY